MRTRQEQKERTRRAILDAALELTGEYGFAGVSLRQVTRASGVVPTAFYRHFANMSDLGLALVGESFETLRRMLRDARRDPHTFDDVAASSAEILVRVVKQRPEHFAFIARERFGAVPAVREAIRHQLDLFVSELAVDLARFPHIESWPTEDVQMVAKLYVNNMVGTAEDIIELPAGRPDLEAQLAVRAKRQMRMIAIGFKDWKPQ